MRSPVADATRRHRQAWFDATTPGERVALLERLSADGLLRFRQTHGLDRPTAVACIKATRRIGRRPSTIAAL